MLSENNRSINIVLVDDEEDFLKISERFLKKQNENYLIRTFQSPINFLNVLKEEKDDLIDVIISDYDMPGLNGLELLAETQKFTKASFIMVTGKGREELVIEALNNGVTYYLQKSIDNNSLFRELNHYITTVYEKQIMERELLETRELNRTLVNLSPEGIIIHIDGIIQFCNETILKSSGYEEKNLLGTNLLNLVAKDFKAKVEERMKKVSKGINIPFKKLKIIKANGEILNVETTARSIQYKGKKGLIAYIRV